MIPRVIFYLLQYTSGFNVVSNGRNVVSNGRDSGNCGLFLRNDFTPSGILSRLDCREQNLLSRNCCGKKARADPALERPYIEASHSKSAVANPSGAISALARQKKSAAIFAVNIIFRPENIFGIFWDYILMYAKTCF